MLILDKISKSYDGRPVLNEVSFTVPTGKICALLGLNGAGKSTLMKIICGLAFAQDGDVTLNGRSLLNQPPQGDIGFMIESPAFYRELSGKQNLTALGLLYDNLPPYRVDEVLALVGMTKMAKAPFRKYSLGMKQRLYFAYALLNDPKLLVLDEPFNGIDPVTIKLFKNLITQCAAGGCTVLISGHVIPEIQNVSDCAVILDYGKTVYTDMDVHGKDLTDIFLSLVGDSGEAQ